MHRFFLESEDSVNTNQVFIKNKDSINHIMRVLRVKLGEQIEIVTEDSLYITETKELNSDQIILEICLKTAHTHESSVQIDLFQCMPKGQKLELILQKNVELGVHSFYLIDSNRCIVEWKDKEIPKKLERYEKIIKEAAKQSKRDRIPELFGLIPIKKMGSYISEYDAFIVLYENEHSRGLKSILKDFTGKKIAIFIGPEGGLEPQEIDLLESSGALVTTLGKRILRTETAGFVAVTCAQYELGELE